MNGSSSTADALPGIEGFIISTWRELLTIDEVSSGDNFLDLGGDSIAAAVCLNRIRSRYALDVPIEALLVDTMSARELALLIERSLTEATPNVTGSAHSTRAMTHVTDPGTSERRLERSPLPDAGQVLLPLSVNQEWFLVYNEARLHDGHGPAGTQFPMTLRIRGPVDVTAIQRALNTVVERHAALRARYVRDDHYSAADRLMQVKFFGRTWLFVPGLYRQVVCGRAPVYVQQRAVATAEEMPQVIEDEMSRPLNTATAPLLRATLVTIDTDSAVLLVIMSHLTIDGWGIQIFLREVMGVYAALTGGPACNLPPVGLHYPDFALWQHRQVRAGLLAREEAYWRQQWERLGGAGFLHREMPFARSGPPEGGGPPITRRRALLPAGDAARVKHRVNELRLTPYVLFRTAMAIVLRTYTNKPYVGFWANFANRRNEAVEHMIGWCSNTHVVATEIPLSMTCAAACADMSRAVLEAHRHEALALPALWQKMGRTVDEHDTRINFDLLPPRRRKEAPGRVQPALFRAGIQGMDLDVRVYEDDDTFGLIATFNTGRYEGAGVDGMVSSIARVAAHAADYPGSTVAECARLVD